MLYNAVISGFIIESNMNSKENDGSNQDKGEVKVDLALKNDNQSLDNQDAVTSKIQLENKATEHLRLNNNSNESNMKLVLPSKTAVMLSNGTKSVQSPTSDCANSIEQNVSQVASNISSVFTNTTNIKPQTVNTNSVCQLKHKTVINASSLNLPKSQMHLNLSFTQPNTYFNHNLVSAALNSTAANSTGAKLYSSISPLNASSIPPNLPTSKPNDDIDMKNNVDYASVIEKCPPKVSCSSDSSPEADCSWITKSCGSKRVLNNIGGSIGSTSQGTCCFLRPNINGSREAAGPSGLQRVRFYNKIFNIAYCKYVSTVHIVKCI